MKERWYHVCACCGAKWFDHFSSRTCPRCGLPSSSRERIVPPWLNSAQATRNFDGVVATDALDPMGFNHA